METPRIQDNINKLRTDIEQYSDKKNVPNKVLETLNRTPLTVKIYVAIPIVILLLLVSFRPEFVKKEYTNEDGTVVMVVSYIKILIYWLVLSSMFIVGYFGYNYKIAKNSEEY